MENLLYRVLGLEFVSSYKGHFVLLFLLCLFYTKWESAGSSNIIFPFCNMAPNGNQTVNGFDLAIIGLFYLPIIWITVDFIQMTFMRGSLAKNR